MGSPAGKDETGDGLSIDLELSENDSLFELKKKLLCDKGFGIKESIFLDDTLCGESLTTCLEKMLQIARIIHLDKVELYFNEESTGFYSPRNEVTALNSILSLLEKSPSSCSNMQMHLAAKNDLRKAVISRINEYRAENIDTRVDENYKCENEKCLVQWGENKGAKTMLQIAYIEGFGRGAIASDDLYVGDVALDIPISILISEEHVYKSDMYHVLEQIDGISTETMLLLWSMKEKHNPDSYFKAYFNSLPENFNTGLSFGMNAIMASDGTLLLEEIMQAKELLRVKYDELFTVLSDHPDIFPLEFYTWEQFLWGCELWYSNSMQVSFGDGKLRTCLVPIAGFLNHSVQPHIVRYGKVDTVTNSLKFPLSRPCRKGEQCFLSYGNYSSSHLITFYGFLPQGDNPYDIIPLDIDIDGADDSKEDYPTSFWDTHMVRGTWFSNNHNIFNYGLPSPLLNYLRRARNPDKKLVPPNLETEMEVLEDLQSMFSDMMQNLGETDDIDRENASWDVNLAVSFKSLQMRIVSSILDSCSAGLKLVETKGSS